MKRLTQTIATILLCALAILVSPLLALAFGVLLLCLFALLVGLSLLDSFEGWLWERGRRRQRIAWDELSKEKKRNAAARAVRP